MRRHVSAEVLALYREGAVSARKAAGIASHHNPESEKEENVMAHLINVADTICKKKGIGFSGDYVQLPVSKEGRELFSLDEEGERELMALLDRELKEAETFVNMPQ